MIQQSDSTKDDSKWTISRCLLRVLGSEGPWDAEVPPTFLIRGCAAIFCTLWVTAATASPSWLLLCEAALVIRTSLYIWTPKSLCNPPCPPWALFCPLELLRFCLIPLPHNTNKWPRFKVSTLTLPTFHQKIKLCAWDVVVWGYWGKEGEKMKSDNHSGWAG